MILPVTEVDSIRYIQKEHTSHITAFESVFDKVEIKDKERKERAKKQREKKNAIKRKIKKEQEEHGKREEARRVLEEQRIAAEQAVRIKQESVRTRNSSIGITWAEVSPEQASQYMAQGTGVSSDVWAGVIYRESSNNPYALNSLGCFGYLQIMQSVHGNVSSWSPKAYLDKAIEIYHSQGSKAWEAW